MGLEEQIANLEVEKAYQHHKDAVAKLEDQIIDLVDQHLLATSPQYRADSTEYERLYDLIEQALLLKEYINALDKAIKETRGATGAQIGDVIIPGEIGTLGSSMQTKIANMAQQNVGGLFGKINTDNKKLRVKETHMTDLFAGMDVIFDALKISLGRTGLDITSGVAAVDHAIMAGNILEVIQEGWKIFDRINPENLKMEFETMGNKIRNSIAQERAKYS